MLTDLVNAELTPYRGGGSQVHIRDEGIWLDSRAYSVMALVMLLSATFGARDAFEVVVQRVVLTSGAMVGAIALLSLLEAVFIPRKAKRQPQSVRAATT